MELKGEIQAELAEKAEEVSERLVGLINQHISPPVPVTKENIYIRTMFVVSDQVNSYGGCLPVEEHPNVARLLIDSPVLIGHNKDRLPIGRNFKSELVQRKGQNWIKVWFYWLKGTPQAETLLASIDHGIYKECSIGFLFEIPECSVCQKDIRTCEHIPLAPCANGTAKVFFNYRGVRKVLETSLVYRGAVPGTALSNELFQKANSDGLTPLSKTEKESATSVVSHRQGKDCPGSAKPYTTFELVQTHRQPKSNMGNWQGIKKVTFLILHHTDKKTEIYELVGFDAGQLRLGKRFVLLEGHRWWNTRTAQPALIDQGVVKTLVKSDSAIGLELFGKTLTGKFEISEIKSRGLKTRLFSLSKTCGDPEKTGSPQADR